MFYLAQRMLGPGASLCFVFQWGGDSVLWVGAACLRVFNMGVDGFGPLVARQEEAAALQRDFVFASGPILRGCVDPPVN